MLNYPLIAFSLCYSYPPAIALIASDKVRPSPMITHRYSLENIQQALEFVASKNNGAIKVMIDCDNGKWKKIVTGRIKDYVMYTLFDFSVNKPFIIIMQYLSSLYRIMKSRGATTESEPLLHVLL